MNMDWQIPFLEHVRKAHFTLLATSLVLFVAATLTPTALIEKAYNQARIVLSIKEDAFRPIRSKTISEQFNVIFMVDEKYFEPLWAAHELFDEIKDETLSRFSSLNSEQIAYSWSWDSVVKTKGNLWSHSFSSDIYSLRPHTLKRFITAWDFYWNGKALEVENIDWDNMRIYSHGKQLQPSQISMEDIDSFDFKAALRVEKDPNRSFVRPQWFVVAEIKNKNELFSFDELHIPILARKRFDLDMQDAMFKDSAGNEYRGEFKEAFGDLAEYSKELETLELEPLAAYLRKRYKEDDKKIVVFGIDITRSIIGQWGLFVLAFSQIYYLLHFYRLKFLNIDQAIYKKFAWIMVYPGILPKLAAVSTVTVIPAASSLLLFCSIWNESTTVLAQVFLIVGLIMNLLLVIVTFWVYRQEKNVLSLKLEAKK